MKNQNQFIPDDILMETYKNVVDKFGGPQGMAEQFNWSISTIYSWLRGRVMGLTHAICIVIRDSSISLKSLIGYELDCDPVYLRVIGYFGSQSATASALGVAQTTARAWLMGDSRISLDKAELLEVITNGEFHPSDFPHLCDQAKRILSASGG